MFNCTVESLISLGPGCLRVIFISQQALEFFQGNPAFYSRCPSSTTANFTASPVYKYIHLFLEALKSPFMLLMHPSTSESNGRQEVMWPLLFPELCGSQGMEGLFPWWTVKRAIAKLATRVSSPSAWTFFSVVAMESANSPDLWPSTWLKPDCDSEHVGGVSAPSYKLY